MLCSFFTCLTNLGLFQCLFVVVCLCLLLVLCVCFKVNVNICGRITSEMSSFSSLFSPHFTSSWFLLQFLSLKFLPIVFFCVEFVIDFVFKFKFKILHLASLVSCSRSPRLACFDHLSLSWFLLSLFSKSVVVDLL